MFKEREVKLYLQDILDEIRSIKNFTKEVRSFEEFSQNELVCYAVFKALENIGEAVKKLPENIKELYPIDWKKIAGIRDILIHRYFEINLKVVWKVIHHKLSELELAIQIILKKLNQE